MDNNSVKNNRQAVFTHDFADKQIDCGIYCAHHIFEQQVTKTPDHTAVSLGEQSLSYFELNRLSNQLAHYLGNYVIKPNTLIALYMAPSIELSIAVLAVFKAGGACLILDTHADSSQISDQLKCSNISIVVTQRALKANIATNDVTLLNLDGITLWTQNLFTDNNPVSPTEPAHLACMLPKPSSNDIAKPLFLSHTTLIKIIQQLQHSYHPPQYKTLQYNPINSLIFLLEVFSTWFSSATLVIMPQTLRQKAFMFWHFIEQESIHRIILEPDQLQTLANNYKYTVHNAAYNLASPSTLREIIVTDKLYTTDTALQCLLSALPGCKLIEQPAAFSPCIDSTLH